MAQRLAGLFFCPMRASPANRISMSRAISIQARFKRARILWIGSPLRPAL
jgi:hypothetical protein